MILGPVVHLKTLFEGSVSLNFRKLSVSLSTLSVTRRCHWLWRMKLYVYIWRIWGMKPCLFANYVLVKFLKRFLFCAAVGFQKWNGIFSQGRKMKAHIFVGCREWKPSAFDECDKYLALNISTDLKLISCTFKTASDYESRDQLGWLAKTNSEMKNSPACLLMFKGTLWRTLEMAAERGCLQFPPQEAHGCQ